MRKIEILVFTLLTSCTLAHSQSSQTETGTHPIGPPSTQTVWIVAIVALTLIGIGIGGTIALKAIGKAAYEQGSAPNAPESFNAFFLQSARISIVAVILMATVVLALYDRLDKGAIGVLSGVAGYVLGGADKDGKRKKPRGNAEVKSQPGK